MPNYHVLIIEDDRSLTDILTYNLEQAGYRVSLAHDGRDGLNRAQNQTPDIIVLDLMLPVIDGLEVCRRIRADPMLTDILVIMLTARTEESDQVVGLAMGADDYVGKPFSIKVLMERMKALLRRRKQNTSAHQVMSCHGVVVDKERHQVTVNNELLDLTRSEFALLEMLVRQPGRVFSRSQLIETGLGDPLILDRTVDVHIRAIRRKLGTRADLVQTVRGVGYRFRDPLR